MNKLLIFLAGAGIGSGITWLIVKKHYEKKADEEIESVVSRFRDPMPFKIVEPEPDKEEKMNRYVELTKNYTKPNPIDYAAKYQNKSSEQKDEVDYSATEHPEDDDEETPYVIPPEKFGELDGYDTVSLTYYADGYLVEGDLGIIDDVDAVVGPEALDSFGEYEEDSVYVRNDQHKTDYEILLSEMNYHDEP